MPCSTAELQAPNKTQHKITSCQTFRQVYRRVCVNVPWHVTQYCQFCCSAYALMFSDWTTPLLLILQNQPVLPGGQLGIRSTLTGHLARQVGSARQSVWLKRCKVKGRGAAQLQNIRACAGVKSDNSNSVARRRQRTTSPPMVAKALSEVQSACGQPYLTACICSPHDIICKNSTLDTCEKPGVCFTVLHVCRLA